MYSIDDCVLIRKTSIFPKNHIVQTPVHGMAYDFGKSEYLGDAIGDVIREMCPPGDSEKFLEEFRKYYVYFETYRSSIHFTINGVVANSLYGEFDYPYAIIEPLKYHINDEQLKTLRVEDTYFDDDIELSEDAIILVPEDKAMELDEEYDFSKYTVRTYNGEIGEAIKEVLEEKGYDFFTCNDHGYVHGWDTGTKDAEMYDYISELAGEKGIPQKEHFYSELNHEDIRRRIEAAEVTDLLHLQMVLDSGLVSEEVKDEIIRLLPEKEYHKLRMKELMRKVVDEVGLDKLFLITQEFNKQMVEERNSSLAKRKQEVY